MTIKAIVSEAVGPASSLKMVELPAPTPNGGEVAIKVKAVGINFPDSLIIEDKYQFRPARPFAPGGEISGEIIGLGDGVSGFAIGQKVMAQIGWGGLATEITCGAEKIAAIPENMDFAQAAGFSYVYGTSHHALKQRAVLKVGETLLVLGAAGGVGLAAVQLGKAMGARVVAAVSSQEKADFCLKHGADAAIIYPYAPLDKAQQKTLSDEIKAACNGGADVIYDAVGGDYGEPALRAINWKGRYLVVGFPAGIPSFPLNLPLLKGCAVVGVFWGAFAAREPKEAQTNMAELLALFAKGNIAPAISKIYDFADAPRAIEDLANRKALGKIVVRIED